MTDRSDVMPKRAMGRPPLSDAGSRQIYLLLPVDLANKVDALRGKKKRSQYIRELLEREAASI